MKRIEADWLRNAETQRVFEVLSASGHSAYAVGGCVRNSILGQPVSDIDIATSAKPQETMDLARSAGLKAIPTGFDHGTVTLVSSNTAFEVTTFRRDIQTDGRHAVVSFTDDITDDARRRDFTMNAIYVDAGGFVNDPLGGLRDLTARRVRFIEDAGARIREDYLRSLRFFRFHAQYGDADEGLDPEALSAIARNIDGLSGLAAERIGSEMLKLLAAPDPAPALAGMSATGALTAILPGSRDAWLGPLVHLELENNRAPDPLRRLAVLGGHDAVSRFRLSRAEAKQYEQISRSARGMTPLHEMAWRYGQDLAWSIILVRQALSEQPLMPGTKAIIERAAAAEFPLGASDLMEQVTGPALGAALKRAEAAWIESDFVLDRGMLKMIALKEG